jgi:hypothetical protein
MVLLLAFIFLLGISIPAQAANMKVKVCHIPPGNPANFHTIIISDKAVPTHLAHGDLLGACEIDAEIRCDDGNACTIDAFLPGTVICDNSQPTDCNDRTSCTADSCDPTLGCQNDTVIICESNLCILSTCNGEGSVPFCDEVSAEMCEDGFECEPELGCVPTTATVGNKVYNDLNNNGVQDTAEPGIAGITVELDCGGGVANQVTDVNGNYLFTGIPAPATCSVSLPDPPPTGFESGQCSDVFTVDLNGGESFLDADFCFFSPENSCPCEGEMIEGGIAWDDSFTAASCSFLSAEWVSVKSVDGELFVQESGTSRCFILGGLQESFTSDILTPVQLNACIGSMVEIAANDGIRCNPL